VEICSARPQNRGGVSRAERAREDQAADHARQRGDDFIVALSSPAPGAEEVTHPAHPRPNAASQRLSCRSVGASDLRPESSERTPALRVRRVLLAQIGVDHRIESSRTKTPCARVVTELVLELFRKNSERIEG